MLMCFVLSCAIYFSAIALAGWLSVCRITSFFCSNVNPNSDKSCIVHIISYTAADIAMCSASADESATVGWHLLLQLITCPFKYHISSCWSSCINTSSPITITVSTYFNSHSQIHCRNQLNSLSPLQLLLKWFRAVRFESNARPSLTRCFKIVF